MRVRLKLNYTFRSVSNADPDVAAVLERRDILTVRDDSAAQGRPAWRVTANAIGGLVGCYLYKEECEPVEPLVPGQESFSVKFGSSIAYQGLDKDKAHKVFDILKQAKEQAKAHDDVSILITA